MRKPTSSSRNAIAALVAAAFGLTAGPALAQTTAQSNPSSAPANHRHASKKSVRQLSSQVKEESREMRATTGKLNRATAQLNHATQQMKQARSKEMRVASAEHHVKKGEHVQRTHVRTRMTRPANTTPPPR